ncbi:MAG: ATP-binding cassette domain-containing protein [Azospirillum sp.]|nr:ATP-binding cassette domain-containing protein [Azospirillum sp.]
MSDLLGVNTALWRRGGVRAVAASGLSLVAGGLHGGLIVYLGIAAERLHQTPAGLALALGFAALLCVYLAVLGFALRLSFHSAEAFGYGFALEIAQQLRRAELVVVQRVGEDRLKASLTQDVATLATGASQALGMTMAAGETAVCAAALMRIAPEIALFGLLALGAGWLLRRQSQSSAVFSAQAQADEQRFAALMPDLIDGFRDLTQDRRKADALFDRFLGPAAEDSFVSRSAGIAETLAERRAGSLCWAVLLVAATFVAPRLGIEAGTVTAVFVLCMLQRPLTAVMASWPDLAVAGAALGRLEELRLAVTPPEAATAAARPEGVATPAAVRRFASITMEAVTFGFSDAGGERAFSVGPIDFALQSGEIVFLTGGNGSGKSTFLKLLTGLYPAQSGAILLNGRMVERSAYRSAFAAVFSDGHLFDRLYGIAGYDAARGAELLDQFGLSGKVSIKDGRLSSARLSLAQRKRLALLMVLLEDRPVLVLDEWAAEQDPAFRELFFTTLLPDLRARGTTIIAATQDDHYFHCCDRLLTIQDGRILQ